MPPSTQNSTPTVGVDKKMCIRKILQVLQYSDLSLSICGLRDMGYAKVWKRIKIWTHEGPRRKKMGTHEGPKVLKKDEHMKAHKKKKMKW